MTRFASRSHWGSIVARVALVLTVLLSASGRPAGAEGEARTTFTRIPSLSPPLRDQGARTPSLNPDEVVLFPQSGERLPFNSLRGFNLTTEFTPSQYRGTERTSAVFSRQMQIDTDFGGLHVSGDWMDSRLLPPNHPLARGTTPQAGWGAAMLPFQARASESPFLKGERALQAQQFQLSGKTFALTYGRLNVGKVTSPDLVSKMVSATNQQFAERGKFGPDQSPLLALRNVAALNGLRERDLGLRFTPSQSVGFEMEQADVKLGTSRIASSDLKLNIGTFNLTRKLRNVSHTFTDAALDAMGRPDLKPLKGVRTEELNAAWNPTKNLSFTHYAKNDLINRTGRLAEARAVRVEKNALAFTPNKTTSLQWTDQRFSTAMHQRAAETPKDDWRLQILDLKLGNFTLHRKAQSTSHRFSDPLLDQFGRADLKPLRGLETKELSINWNASKALSFSHYAKDELVNKAGNLASATESHYRRNVLTLTPSKSTTFQLTDERTTSGTAQRAPGQSLNEFRTRTLFLSQRLSKQGALINLTQRAFDHTVGGKAIDGSERLLHFDTGNHNRLSFKGDYGAMNLSNGTWNKLFRLNYKANPMKQLSIVGDMLNQESNTASQSINNYAITYALDKERQIAFTQRHQETQNGAVRTLDEQKLFTITPTKNTKIEMLSSHVFNPKVPDTRLRRISFAYQMDKVRQLSLTKSEQTVQVGGDLRVNSQMALSLVPARGMKLDFVNQEQTVGGKGLETRQITLRKQMGKDMAVALRSTNWAQTGLGGDSHFGVFIERKSKRYNMEFGQEVLRDGKGQFNPTTYIKLQAQPAKNWTVNLALADHEALVQNLVAPRGWEVKGALGKLTLEAKNWASKVPVPNQPNVFQYANEQAFTLRMPFSKNLQLAASLIDRYNQTTRVGGAEKVLALSDAPGGVSDWSLKLIAKEQVNGSKNADSNALEFAYRRFISEENQMTLTARFAQGSASAKGDVNIYFGMRKVW